MDILNAKRDPKLAREGTWVSDIPDMGDLELKVRGLNTPEFNQARAKRIRKAPREWKQMDGTLTPERDLQVFKEALAEACLLDWKNLTEDGKEVKFTDKRAWDFCTLEEFNLFADAVTWAAQVVDKGYGETFKALEKNSPALSDGN